MMKTVEELLECPYWIIDILPLQVPKDSPGQYFAVEKYFLQDKRIEEIKSLDLSRMSEESRVLLYCVIQSENKQFLLNLPNLSALREQKPLSKPLTITTRRRINNIPIYKHYGVIY